LSSTGSPPALADSYSFTVQVTDTCGDITPQPLTLIVPGIVGTVEWDGNSIPNVTVQLKAVGNFYTLPALVSTATGSDGKFHFENPPIGQFTVYALAPSSEYWAWLGYPVTTVAGSLENVGAMLLSKVMQLLSPANNVSTTTTPTLQWAAFPGATGYQVEVFNNTTSANVFTQSTGNTQITISPALSPGSYQWGVYAHDASYPIADYSAFEFTVRGQPGAITLLDPVPSGPFTGFLAPQPSSGSPIISTPATAASLASSARMVQGVASDGVTKVVVQVRGALPNEHLSLTVSGDGGLAQLGSSSFQPSSLTWQADDQGNAFALYQAPVDFNTGSDGGSVSRPVTLQLSSLDDPTFTAASQIAVIRPLVMLIHGLWSGSQEAWGNFTPLVNDPQARFEVIDGQYDNRGFVVSASDPYYPPWLMSNLRGSALGLSYSTPLVLQQLQVGLQAFRNGTNPVGIPVAATQADIVAHSMGGLVARNLVLQPGYFSPKDFGAGLIHKMITIDTPHLGTPLATALLNPANGCVAGILASGGDLALNEVLTQFGLINGAVADLQGAGDGTQMSVALQALAQSSGTPIPVALIAAETAGANLSGLSLSPGANLISGLCDVPPLTSDPLAAALTPGSWNSIFVSSGDPTGSNDGAVGEYSQSDGLGMVPGLVFGYIHSSGLEMLGFSPPTVLDPGTIPNQVIDLLNTSKLNTFYYQQLAP
jgi:pimeloyl-ACP methyl ester carboxylesterase